MRRGEFDDVRVRSFPRTGGPGAYPGHHPHPVPVYKKPCLGGCGMDLYWNQLPGTERDPDKTADFCPDCANGQPEDVPDN